MVTQRDIQRAFSTPPFPATTCTLSQIQAVIPGIVPLPATPLPEWPERLKATAWDIGLDFIPYDTTIWYRFDWELQRTSLIGLGSAAGQGSYQDRSDNVLYASAPATNPMFQWTNGLWQHTACGEWTPVAVPSPDWLARGSTPARIRASIADNPDFGLAPGQTLNLISKILPRDPPVLSLFWLWFTDDGQGVYQRGELFSECEFASEPQHQIVLVDYVTFERHSNTIVRSDFDDPCPRPAARGASVVQGNSDITLIDLQK
jgi:hypothetical protein